MKPSQIAAHYDLLAEWYQKVIPDTYGMAPLERALKFLQPRKKPGFALDVGCGSEGRFIDLFLKRGFKVHGMDISPVMIALAKKRARRATFFTADICKWKLPKKYQFISAWDSTFHLPIEDQQPVLEKLCHGLVPQGVLLFTCGGGSPGEITGTMQGLEFGYSTLGVDEYLRILRENDCHCCHVEYDQMPAKHVYIIAQKNLIEDISRPETEAERMA